MPSTVFGRITDTLANFAEPGTPVGDHRALTAFGALVVVPCTYKVARDVYELVPAETRQRVATICKNVAPYGAALTCEIIASVALEESGASFAAHHAMRGVIGAAIGAAAILRGVEIVGYKCDIPYARAALSGLINELEEHGVALGGATLAAVGLGAISAGAQLSASSGAPGFGLVAAGVAGVLGGAELMGRDFDWPYVRRCFTGLARYLVYSGPGWRGLGVGLQGAGAAATYYGAELLAFGESRLFDGADFLDSVGARTLRHVFSGSNIVDGIGAAAITLGTSVAVIGWGFFRERDRNLDAALRPLHEHRYGVAGVSVGAAAVAAAKFATARVASGGLGYVNTQIITGAGMLGLRSAQLMAEQIAGKSAARERYFEKANDMLTVSSMTTCAGLAYNDGLQTLQSEPSFAAVATTLANFNIATLLGSAALSRAGAVLGLDSVANYAGAVVETIARPICDGIQVAYDNHQFVAGVAFAGAVVGAYMHLRA